MRESVQPVIQSHHPHAQTHRVQAVYLQQVRSLLSEKSRPATSCRNATHNATKRTKYTINRTSRHHTSGVAESVAKGNVRDTAPISPANARTFFAHSVPETISAPSTESRTPHRFSISELAKPCSPKAWTWKHICVCIWMAWTKLTNLYIWTESMWLLFHKSFKELENQIINHKANMYVINIDTFKLNFSILI